LFFPDVRINLPWMMGPCVPPFGVIGLAFHPSEAEPVVPIVSVVVVEGAIGIHVPHIIGIGAFQD
jgi:hypothetical protein